MPPYLHIQELNYYFEIKCFFSAKCFYGNQIYEQMLLCYSFMNSCSFSQYLRFILTFLLPVEKNANFLIATIPNAE